MISNENKEKQKEVVYSYECTNIISLSAYIYEGTQETNIDIF